MASRVMDPGRSATMMREIDQGAYDAPASRVRQSSAASTSGGSGAGAPADRPFHRTRPLAGGRKRGVYEECVRGDPKYLVAVSTGLARY